MELHLLLLPLLLSLSVVGSNSSAGSGGSVLQFKSEEPLSSYVYSPATDSFFVGGTNHVYELSPSLSPLHDLSTGPRLDSPSCHASGCSANTSTVLTDNVNKFLLVDTENQKLISCGSLFQVGTGITKKDKLLRSSTSVVLNCNLS